MKRNYHRLIVIISNLKTFSDKAHINLDHTTLPRSPRSRYTNIRASRMSPPPAAAEVPQSVTMATPLLSRISVRQYFFVANICMKFFIAASKITFNHVLKKNYVHWKLISKSKEPVKVGTIFHAEYLAPNDQSKLTKVYLFTQWAAAFGARENTYQGRFTR